MSAYFSRLAGMLLLAILLAGLGIPGATAGTEKEVAKKNNHQTIVYTVQPGDTLWEIAAFFNTSLKLLIRANGLETTVIHPGRHLVIPPQDQPGRIHPSRGGISREDLMLLARAIFAEARGESFTGQVAVGAVIINRVNSTFFPDTVREVIMQRNRQTFQFTPVANGTINLEPNQTAIEAAIKALEGHDPTGGALFFYNPAISTDRWITTLPVVTRIGRHVFAAKT